MSVKIQKRDTHDKIRDVIEIYSKNREEVDI
jgi:hypothetical protein